MNRLAKNKHIIIYGLSLAVMLFLMRWLEYRFIIIDNSLELYIAAIAIIFTSLGIWLALKLNSPKVKTVHVEKEIYVYRNNGPFLLNEAALAEVAISRRELEVLQLMGEGFSNQEIAQRLFVSLNTIKTHSSNIFGKLEVDRRTQAVDKAKKLNLIA
ncbi:response regulator transcription factor [Mucilaginibacter dorajii]|nr:LuxR C-terminal-related transcriptional regulator [Mucilaginibacter dorajii]MCS3736252.1 DNA-binding CsgD family transcriptional regulator [Mucilaginibacter dorajii]